MAVLWGRSYTRMELLRRVGDIRQLANVEPFELMDGGERGVRAVRLRNAGGLEMVVVTDRGMSVTEVNFQGIPIAFLTGIGPVHPAYSEPTGTGWLRTWPGGFVTPCGLTQVGSPCVDEGEVLGLHGRIAGIPARDVRCGGDWKDEDYYIYVEGTARQASFFGEDVTLHRRIGTWLGSTRFWIEDTIENLSFKHTPLMLLQHFNLGFPLVDAGTRLELPKHATRSRDAVAQVGFERYNLFEEPQTGFQEQVYYHELQASAADQVEVRLINPNFDRGRGLSVYWKYSLSDYPVLVEWKMMGEGQYVVGVEPANCHVSGRCEERTLGTLQMLNPRETRKYLIEVGFSSP